MCIIQKRTNSGEVTSFLFLFFYSCRLPYLKIVVAVLLQIGSLLICDVLRDLIPFVQSKKRGKHPWRSVSFYKVAG